MKNPFKDDSVLSGVLLSLGSEVLTALLLAVALMIANCSVEDHIRWFAVCFVPPLLFLRRSAKQKSTPVATKTIIIVLFVSFVAYMYMLFTLKAIEL